ncbi:MAG: hypothetical protein NE327_05245 [Lentisphaeraceae bacterium]|nr:hypothetical protein [Lentisphaeraceae bacterium]
MEIDLVIPDQKVIKDVRAFLEHCDWQLEIEEQIKLLPKNIKLEIQTKAFIKAKAPDIFLGDHYEVVVFLGCIKSKENWIPEYGYIKLYYDLNGVYISEDRYSN